MSTVKVTMDGLDEIMAALDPKAYERAVSTTVREVGRGARAELSKSIREQYEVKAAKIKEQVHVYRVDDEIIMHISSKGLPISAFKVSRLRRSVRKKEKGAGPVRVRIRKDRPAEVAKELFWVAKKNNQVFKRMTKYDRAASKAQKRVMRSRIVKALSLSVAQMTHKDRQQEILKVMTDKFWKRYRHNLERKLWRNK